jgi:hypothetical protein
MRSRDRDFICTKIPEKYLRFASYELAKRTQET